MPSEKPTFEDRLLRLVGDLLDPERERVEVHEQLPVAHQAAARDVGVAERACAGGRAWPRRTRISAEHLGIMGEVAVVAVHQLRLAEVDRLDAQVDVRRRQEVEPELGLGPAHVRDGLARPPVVLAPAVGIEHVGVAEVPLLHRPAQRDERPFRHGDLLDLRGHDLEDAGLEDHLRVGRVDLRDLLLGPFEVAEQVRPRRPRGRGLGR